MVQACMYDAYLSLTTVIVSLADLFSTFPLGYFMHV